MKTKFLAIVLFVLLISTMVSALTVSGAANVNLCQCETVREVYEVCAGTGEAGTYTVSHSGLASKWVSIAPTQIALNDGECKPVYVFTTPECYANSGTYPIEIKVSGAIEASRNFNVVVNQCHTFDFTITPTKNTSRACETNTYEVYVRNTSKFADKFVFTQNGLSDDWVTYNRSSFVLKAGEELRTTVKVVSACNASSGNYPFEFGISNTQTNISTSRNLVQEIISFTPFTHNFSTNINTCSEENQTRTFSIKNNSIFNDEYSLKLNNTEYVSLSTNKLVLDANSLGEVVLTINSTAPKEFVSIITLTSKKYLTDYNISVRVNVEDCYNHSLERVSEESQFCVGNNTQEFVLTNSGTKDSIITVSTSGITTQAKEYLVSAKSSKNISINFDEAAEGNKKVTIKADSNYESKSIEYDLSFENCYGTNLVTQEIDVCANTTMTKSITIQNSGTKNQEYELAIDADWITLSENNFSLNSMESKNINLTMQTPSTVNENYLLTAKTANTTLTRTILINLLTNEECYNFSAENLDQVIDVNCCSGEIVELFVTNTGLFDQEITLQKVSPPWVAFSEDSITVLAGQTVKTFVYFSPPVGTNGDYIATIKLTNDKGIIKNYDFNVNVYGGNCGVYLEAGIDVNNSIANTIISVKKDVVVEFIVTNDSNIAFSILDMNTNEYESKIEFPRGINLQPGESVKAIMTIGLGENPLPQSDVDVVVNVMTSAGNFTKTQRVNLSAANDAGIPSYDLTITGMFANFAAPLTGLILLIVILIIIVVVATKAKKPVGKKK